MLLDFDGFKALCADPLGGVDPAQAEMVDSGVPVYDGGRLRAAAATESDAHSLRTEMASVLADGPGVLVIRDAWPDGDILDRVTDLFWQIIDDERDHRPDADHFAAAGSNTRIWDSLTKIAVRDPELYLRYYANPVFDLVCEAWLGPWYQVTAQVNVVHPGGQAQSPHRDYHLGFLSNDDADRFPRHVHDLSKFLTLQGAVAHTAMPLEAGPTMVLPGSQRFEAGFVAWRDQRFKDHFAQHMVQLPLDPGDALFFNPGIHHGAGSNRTSDHERIGNLVQVSSAFGVAMEAIDWRRITSAVYPALVDLFAAGKLTSHHLAVSASGYAFPTNLDRDPADAGLAPPSARALLRESLDAGLSHADFDQALADLVGRKRPN